MHKGQFSGNHCAKRSSNTNFHDDPLSLLNFKLYFYYPLRKLRLISPAVYCAGRDPRSAVVNFTAVRIRVELTDQARTQILGYQFGLC